MTREDHLHDLLDAHAPADEKEACRNLWANVHVLLK